MFKNVVFIFKKDVRWLKLEYSFSKISKLRFFYKYYLYENFLNYL